MKPKHNYQNELKARLKATTPSLTLLYGDGEFFIHYFSLLVLNKIRASHPDAEVYRFYYSEFDYKEIASLLGQPSLFSSCSIIVLRMDTKINKREGDELARLFRLLADSDSSYLILEYYHNEKYTSYEYLNNALKIKGLISDGVNSADARLFKESEAEALVFLRAKAKGLGLEMSDEALIYLYNHFSNELAASLNELNKYALVEKSAPIDAAMIKKLSFAINDMDVDALIRLLFTHSSMKDITSALESINDSGQSERDIAVGLQRYFYSILALHATYKLKGHASSYDALGYTPPRDVEERMRAHALATPLSSLSAILLRLNRLRHEIQTTAKNSRALTLSTLINIKGMLG